LEYENISQGLCESNGDDEEIKVLHERLMNRNGIVFAEVPVGEEGEEHSTSGLAVYGSAIKQLVLILPLTIESRTN
jgi:hypothetical protein